MTGESVPIGDLVVAGNDYRFSGSPSPGHHRRDHVQDLMVWVSPGPSGDVVSKKGLYS